MERASSSSVAKIVGATSITVTSTPSVAIAKANSTEIIPPPMITKR